MVFGDIFLIYNNFMALALQACCSHGLAVVLLASSLSHSLVFGTWEEASKLQAVQAQITGTIAISNELYFKLYFVSV